MYLEKEVNKSLSEGHIQEAFDIINHELLKNELTIKRKCSLYYLKGSIYFNEIKDSNKALQTINEGLLIDANDYELLLLKSRIYTYGFLGADFVKIKENLDYALKLANMSEVSLNSYHSLRDSEDSEDSKYHPEDYGLNPFATDKAQIKSLQNEIKNLIPLIDLYERTYNLQQSIGNTEEKLFKERIRFMEMFGLFVAIFAFIFTGIQFSLKFDLPESIAAIVAVGFVLIIFLSVLVMVLHREERTKQFITIIIIISLILLFILPIAPKIVRYIISVLNF
ncbi:MAG: hypothetical protein K1X86_08150 [Ignavibacteria bacterium]|nr:hypothetical protein [Ignavibacteria bacterium]